MLSIKKLTVSVEKKEILTNISTTFRPGKIYAIMGPNGSGKSTLARTVMGDPAFKVATASSIILNRVEITKMSPDKRATLGIFLSAQSPLEIPGVTVAQLLRRATADRKISAVELKKEIDHIARNLKIPDELLSRSLNVGFSGGERKKLEVLQAAILDPRFIFLDEIDTGVDVDALKTIAQFLKKFIKNTKKTLVIITHYNRILKYLPPHEVIVISNGRIIKKGDKKLPRLIESKGYDAL